MRQCRTPILFRAIKKSPYPRCAIILQARINSSRFPGKIVQNIGSHTIIEHAMRTLKEISVTDYIVATNCYSIRYIQKYIDCSNFELYVGCDDDVLRRFSAIILKKKYQYIIRATADNPFISLFFAQQSQRTFLSTHCQYFAYSNLPKGVGVEVISAPAIIAANNATRNKYDREHVTPFIYNNTDRFTCIRTPAPKNCQSDINLSVDTYTDLLRVTEIYHRCGSKRRIEPWDLTNLI